MDDRRAEVLDIVEAAFRGDAARFLRPDPQLQPERLRAGRDRLLRMCRGVLGTAEDVDEIDRTVDVGERRDALHTEHVVAVERAHRDDVVALREEVRMTPWLGFAGFGEAPTSAIVFV